MRAEAGGPQRALSRAAPRKHKTRARPPASSRWRRLASTPDPSGMVLTFIGQSLGFRHWRQATRSPLLTSATSNLSALPLQWPASLVPTSAESLASACRAHRGPTRTRTASSAARRAPAATGSAWPVPATYRNAEASVGPAWRGGGAGTRCLRAPPRPPEPRPRAPRRFVKLATASPAGPDLPQLRPQSAPQTRSVPATESPAAGSAGPHSRRMPSGGASQFTAP